MAGGGGINAGSVTLTSSGTSAVLQLEPTARTTTLLVNSSGLASTSTAGGTAVFRVEGTLDTWVPGGVTQTWQNLSSQTYSVASTSTSAFALADNGTFFTILGPIAGVRLNSTTWVPTTVTGTLYLRALQSLTAGP